MNKYNTSKMEVKERQSSIQSHQVEGLRVVTTVSSSCDYIITLVRIFSCPAY